MQLQMTACSLFPTVVPFTVYNIKTVYPDTSQEDFIKLD